MTESPSRNIDEFRSTDDGPGEEFVELFTRHQRRIYLYILAQVPNVVDAEEILQETNIVTWRKFGQFQPGSNFFAWACQIATYEVLKFRRRKRRDKLHFSDEFVQRIAVDSLTHSESLELRREALVFCLGRLRPKDRELIQRRYAPGENGKTTAAWFGRPINAVYQSLGRIRRTLQECVSRRLSAEAGS
uniref:RNA polymerase sigma factor n=1 Tax=uncultured planctomycete 3FN TaxID=455066 RepID=A9LGX6_9BACT|nr:RNA polymerase sigma factor [uncultured planctomycete 3FN]